MKKSRMVLIGAMLFACLPAVWAAQTDASTGEHEIFNSDDHNVWFVRNDTMTFAVFGRLQMLGVGENVADPVRNNNRVYLFLKESRLGFRGTYEGYKYETQMQYGGQEQTSGNSPTLTLLDAVVDMPLPIDGASVKVGQFRVPFSREGLTDTGYMPYAVRSIQSLAFDWGRDVGVAAQMYQGNFAGTIGLFAGGGTDVNDNPPHDLPEQLGIPMIAARIGYNDGADEDIYHVVAEDINIKKDEKAAYLNGVFMKDSTVGHSTVINTLGSDKIMLVDPSYNPYIDNEPTGHPASLQDGDLYMAGADAVIRHPIGDNQAISGEAEIDWGGYSNGFGSLHEGSARVQGSYLWKPFEISLRYAALQPDKHMGDAYPAVTGVGGHPAGVSTSPGSEIINEIAPSLTWFIKGQNVKLVGDLPIYLNMPVYTEPGVGSYVFADLPDQNSVITPATGGTFKRETVTEARLMLQFLF